MQDAVNAISEEVVTFQDLTSLRIERWRKANDGPLSEQNLLSKIHSWGFDGKRQETPPGSHLPDHAVESKNLKVVLSGKLRMIIEGQEVLLVQSDCLFIPPGTTCSMEVLGQQPAVNFNAQR